VVHAYNPREARGQRIKVQGLVPGKQNKTKIRRPYSKSRVKKAWEDWRHGSSRRVPALQA
jgi:hypothetical protein